MCHLILLLPFLALPVFWLLPLFPAVTLYAGVVVLSVLVYDYSIKGLHLQVSKKGFDQLDVFGLLRHTLRITKEKTPPKRGPIKNLCNLFRVAVRSHPAARSC
jgi:hypothetical protein